MQITRLKLSAPPIASSVCQAHPCNYQGHPHHEASQQKQLRTLQDTPKPFSGDVLLTSLTTTGSLEQLHYFLGCLSNSLEQSDADIGIWKQQLNPFTIVHPKPISLLSSTLQSLPCTCSSTRNHVLIVKKGVLWEKVRSTPFKTNVLSTVAKRCIWQMFRSIRGWSEEHGRGKRKRNPQSEQQIYMWHQGIWQQGGR